MMNVLHLTATEKVAFEALSDELREGWDVQDENVAYEDTERSRNARFRTMNIQDPWLKDLQKKAAGVTSGDELMAIVQSVDLSSFADTDLSELLFALGPNILSSMITTELQNVSDDQNLEHIVAIATMRHLFFGDK